MGKIQEDLTKLSQKLDLPGQIAAMLPQITLTGFSEIEIDMQKGLLAYSETEIVVAVSLGRVHIEGSGLTVRRMNARRIALTGAITAVHLEWEP